MFILSWVSKLRYFYSWSTFVSKPQIQRKQASFLGNSINSKQKHRTGSWHLFLSHLPYRIIHHQVLLILPPKNWWHLSISPIFPVNISIQATATTHLDNQTGIVPSGLLTCHDTARVIVGCTNLFNSVLCFKPLAFHCL